jgi:outer membrane protein assembly factor BamB
MVRVVEEESCEGCGAPLPKPDDKGWVTCASCGRSYQVAEPTPEPTVEPPAVTINIAGLGDLTEAVTAAGTPTAVGRKAGWLGCIPGVVVLVVGVVIFASVRSCASDARDAIDQVKKAFTTPSNAIALSGSFAQVDAEGSATEGVVVAQENEGSTTTRRIVRIRFGPDGLDELWRSEPIGASDSRAEAALAGDTLFTATGSTLRAYTDSSGSLKWSTKLSDKVTTSCPTCFVAVGRNLVVKTDDGYLYGFGAGSPEPLWSRRLNSAQGGVSVAQGKLFLVDDPKDAAETTPVVTLDPATGSSLHKIRPACPESDSTPWKLELGAGDRIHAVPGSKDVVAAFGFGDSCVARWDPNGSAMAWTLRLEGASSLDDDKLLIGAQHLVVQASGAMVSVDLATGQGALLPFPPDTSATTDRIVGDTLIGDTVSTRGTTRGGLAAWDLASGKLLWATRAPSGAQPASRTRYHSSDALFDEQPRFVLVPDGKALRVWVFEGPEHTFSVTSIDPRTGDLGTPKRREYQRQWDSGTPSLTVESIDARRVVVAVDNLLQAIPVSGEGTIATFPKKG